MKILITGTSGFMGDNIARNLYMNTSHTLYSCSRTLIKKPFGNHYPIDLVNTRDVALTLDSIKPDVIMHFAANPIVKLQEDNPTQIIHDNVIATQNLLHYAPEGCKFIFASSVVVYGDKNHSCHELDLPEPTSVYGATKLSSEHLVNSYTSMGRVRGTNLRLCATVGRGLTHGVVYDFIHKLRSDNPYLEAIGTYPGSQKPFAHISDVINACKLFLDKDITGTFNVTPNDQLTVEEVAHAVMEGLNINKPIKWLGEGANWKGDNKRLDIFSGKLESIGWKRNYNSRDAIVEAVRQIRGDLF